MEIKKEQIYEIFLFRDKLKKVLPNENTNFNSIDRYKRGIVIFGATDVSEIEYDYVNKKVVYVNEETYNKNIIKILNKTP